MHSLEDILNNSGSAPQANAGPQADVIEQPAPPEPETEEPAQEAAETATGDDQGDTPTDQAAPPAASQDDTLDKKISAFQRKAEDETRKRQDYEKQLAEVRKQNEEQAAYIQRVQQHFAQQQRQGQEPEIDLLDPEQAQSFQGNILNSVQSVVQNAILSGRLDDSEYRARQEHGDDVVNAAFDAVEKAGIKQQFINRRDAYADIVKWHQDQQLIAEINADPKAYEDKIIEKYLAEQAKVNPQASQPQTPPRQVPQPPKSLAGVSSVARNPVKHPWSGPTPLHEIIGS